MDSRKARRSLVATLFFALALAFCLVAPRAEAQNKVEAGAKALQKKAMEEDYLTTDFAKAQDKLTQAIAQCGADKCSPQLRALIHRDLGVVQVGGQIDRERGIGNFVAALKDDPSVQLDPDLRTKDLDAAFAEAKKRAGTPVPTAPPPTPTAPPPSGDFTHTPAAEQQVRTPLPIYAEYTGSEELAKVVARYKGYGSTEWKTFELHKMGDKAWGGQLPCVEIVQGATVYYIQGFNAANDPVAVSGDRNNPYRVTIKMEKVADPPHLPNAAPPNQCADKGDCPPDFPGCKKTAAAVSTEAATGKDGGEYCEEDTECKSKECKENKCTEPPQAKSARFWVGVTGALDYTFLPSSDDVCKLDNSTLPINSSNYYCVNSSGNDYPDRTARTENDNLVTGRSDKVAGGGALGNIRILATFDYAATNNVLLGARLGFVANTYPGNAAGQDGKRFPPLHAELRGTYVFGEDPLAKAGLSPMLFISAGVSTWETKVNVSVVEQPSGGAATPRDVKAWQLAGPGFIAGGGGLRYAVTPRVALTGAARVNIAFGNAFALSLGPEVGAAFGF